MESFVTGAAIKERREARGLTQAALAQQLGVSDKAVSKWETGRGLPDITLLEPLAAALGISVPELLAGQCISNSNRQANLRRMKFYVCPICGNIITSCGSAYVSCCGINLPELESEQDDDMHCIKVERIEDEHYITVDHEMSKEHYISFICYVTGDRCDLRKLYPEQNAEVRFLLRGHGDIYIFCNHHGLFRKRV